MKILFKYPACLILNFSCLWYFPLQYQNTPDRVLKGDKYIQILLGLNPSALKLPWILPLTSALTEQATFSGQRRGEKLFYNSLCMLTLSLVPEISVFLSENWRHKWATRFSVCLSNLRAAGIQVGQKRNMILWEGMCFLQVGKAPRREALAISRKILKVQDLISFSWWWNGRALHLWTLGSCTACKAKPRKRLVLF